MIGLISGPDDDSVTDFVFQNLYKEIDSINGRLIEINLSKKSSVTLHYIKTNHPLLGFNHYHQHCSKPYKRKKKLETHIKKYHGPNQDKFKTCTVCDETSYEKPKSFTRSNFTYVPKTKKRETSYFPYSIKRVQSLPILKVNENKGRKKFSGKYRKKT